MKKILFVVLVLAIAVTCFGAKWENSLKPQGKEVSVPITKATAIIISKDAKENEVLASKDLAEFLGKIYNVDIKVLNDTDKISGNFISLGDTKQFKSSKIALPSLNADGYSIINKNNNIYINGGWRSGATTGVYALLEEDLGCRFWTCLGDDTYPTISTKKIVFVPRSYNPSFLTRYTNADVYEESEDWQRKNRAMPWRKEGGCHTVFNYVPVSNFETHPEWFSEYDGVRQPKQVCWSNKEMVDLMTKNAIEALRKSGQNILCISPRDGIPCCACAECEAYDKAHGNTKCASLIRGMNHIAKEVKKEFPNCLVQTLAYLDTINPPENMVLEDNLGIVLCSDSCDWDYPLCDYNESTFFQSKAKEWRKICKNVLSWNYVQNYDHHALPNPNITVVAKNIKIMNGWGLNGVYLQTIAGDSLNNDAYLKTWLWNKLLWDPSLDAKELIKDYCYGYYGDAIGEEMLKYENSLINMYEKAHAIAHNPNEKVSEKVVGNLTVSDRNVEGEGVIFKNGIRWTPEEKIYSDEWINEAETILNKALSLAKTDAEKDKVIYVKSNLDYLIICKKLGYLTLKQGWVSKPELSAEEQEKLKPYLDEFISVLDKYGIKTLAEIGDNFRTRKIITRRWTGRKIDMDKIGMDSIINGWKFCPDDNNEGVAKGYFKEDYDISNWSDIRINNTWDAQGKGSHPYGWYKNKLTIPYDSLQYANGVYLLFQAVDDEATVYVNGKLLFEHTVENLKVPVDDLWDQPFVVNFKDVFRVGENDITVLVGNPNGLGGIYKDVKLCWTFKEVPMADLLYLADE